MRRLVLLLLILFIVPAVHAQSTRQLRTEVNTIAAAARNLPVLEVKNLAETFQLGIEDGFIVLRSALVRPRRDTVRLELKQFPGVATLRIGNDGQPNTPRVPEFFHLNLNAMLEDSTRKTITVLGSAGELQITSADTRNQQRTSITYAQSTGPRPRAQLSIYRNICDEDVPQSQQCVGKDFSDLQRKFPLQIDQYLRPILRELDQESLLVPDVRTARLVVMGHVEAKSSIIEQVDRLLPLLDAPDYRVRDKAVEDMSALGNEVTLAIARLDRTKLSAEQNARLDAVLANHKTLSDKQIRELRTNIPFLLDCLAIDDAEMRAAALVRLQSLRPGVHFDTFAPLQERQVALASLRQKLLSPTTQPTRPQKAQRTPRGE